MDHIVGGLFFVFIGGAAASQYLWELIRVREGKKPRPPISDAEGVSLWEVGDEVEPTRRVMIDLWGGFLLGVAFAAVGVALAAHGLL